MIIGAYYRCPIVIEPGDKTFPRFFVLAQAVEYNELADGVVVKMHDLLGSAAYYADLLTHNIFPAKSLDRCEAMIGGAVSCKGGRGRIICRSCRTDDLDQPYWYWIRLNSGKTIELPETDIKLDYSQMNYAPDKQLRAYEFQHPTWFVNHMKVSKNLHIINNAIYGFEVLAGCRAYLMPHQISTVARCFETMPVRYMLADEVGLGKTVEACSILSILLSNSRELKTLIIAPGALVGQWKNELHYKYGLKAKEKSIDCDVCIVSLEDMVNEWIVSAISWDLVVVDETHRLLGDDALYNTVQMLSRAATHILLLSATPIQERNEEYRRLLALLNPDQYSNMTKDQFASLVKKQSRVQKAVNQQIKRLARYEEYHEEIIEKLEQIAKMLEDRTLNTVDSLTTIRKLKEHGCEVFFEKENIYTFDGKGEILITLMSSLAQEESRSISENVTWGIRDAFSKGKFGMPYGRFLGYRKGAEGPEVDPEQAEIVRKIYRLFLDGDTPTTIAKKLEEEGVPSPTGRKRWHDSTVLSILKKLRVVDLIQ